MLVYFYVIAMTYFNGIFYFNIVKLTAKKDTVLFTNAFFLILLSYFATSFHEGTGWCKESWRVLVQRREQGWEDRGRSQREDQEDRRRKREFHCL